jgi:hypothetical protein
MISHVRYEDLRLVFESPKSPRMQDSIAIPLVRQSQIVLILVLGQAAGRLVGPRGEKG